MAQVAFPEDVRVGIGRETLRRTLAGIVRRRVPETDAEDVVQSALCDALAAQNPPDDPDDVPRCVALSTIPCSARSP